MTPRGLLYVVVAILGTIACGLYWAAYDLIKSGLEVPDALWLGAGTAQGAVGALLVSTKAFPNQKEADAQVSLPATPVTVENTADEPVPTTDAGLTLVELLVALLAVLIVVALLSSKVNL